MVWCLKDCQSDCWIYTSPICVILYVYHDRVIFKINEENVAERWSIWISTSKSFYYCLRYIWSNHNFYFRAGQILKTLYIASFQTTFVSNFTIFYPDGWFVKLFAECNCFRISFMSLIEDLKKSAYQKIRLLYVCELSTYKIGLFLFN